MQLIMPFLSSLLLSFKNIFPYFYMFYSNYTLCNIKKTPCTYLVSFYTDSYYIIVYYYMKISISEDDLTCYMIHSIDNCKRFKFIA